MKRISIDRVHRAIAKVPGVTMVQEVRMGKFFNNPRNVWNVYSPDRTRLVELEQLVGDPDYCHAAVMSRCEVEHGTHSKTVGWDFAFAMNTITDIVRYLKGGESCK